MKQQEPSYKTVILASFALNAAVNPHTISAVRCFHYLISVLWNYWHLHDSVIVCLYEVVGAILLSIFRINSPSLGSAGREEDIGKLGALIDCNSYLVTETNSLIRPKSSWLLQDVLWKNANCVVKFGHLCAGCLTRDMLWACWDKCWSCLYEFSRVRFLYLAK